MKGWSEEEIKNKELMAPCGLYCGVCGVYIATRDKNAKFKTVLGALYGSKPEDTECFGCMQPDPPRKLHPFCRGCKIRECVRSKEYYSCHKCSEWPCGLINEFFEKFPLPTAERVMKRAIPLWRAKTAELGDEKGSEEWIREECRRYHCSSCGQPLFRGAQHCRACKKNVGGELDGSV